MRINESKLKNVKITTTSDVNDSQHHCEHTLVRGTSNHYHAYMITWCYVSQRVRPSTVAQGLLILRDWSTLLLRRLRSGEACINHPLCTSGQGLFDVTLTVTFVGTISVLLNFLTRRNLLPSRACISFVAFLNWRVMTLLSKCVGRLDFCPLELPRTMWVASLLLPKSTWPQYV